MPRDFLDVPHPDDPLNLDPPSPFEPEPGSQLDRHPYVRRLRGEIAALRGIVGRLSNMQREMMSRTLLAGRYLEPLNPAPLGVIAPLNNLPTIVHVDSLRMMYNRVMDADHPTIRILVGGENAKPMHAHWVALDESEVRPLPTALPKRSGAVMVIFTHKPITVLR